MKKSRYSKHHYTQRELERMLDEYRRPEDYEIEHERESTGPMGMLIALLLLGAIVYLVL
jgi:hypothetical protein